ncbi:MAG: APC family permease [Arcanobacterium sp.]|nr:APC family permease [Arcanobacterium sp.]MDY5589799.1 APC family permease [Arcanobacterium sp.]
MAKTQEVADTQQKSQKGLSAGSVTFVGAVVIGLSCIAPPYTLTGSIGPTVSAVGLQTPAIFLIGFIPMLLVAFGYRELNKAMPDSGTSFTWGVRAYGPYLGWMTGWGLVIATTVVLSNLAGIAVDFFYLALSQIFHNPAIAGLSSNVWINVATCLVFMAGATYISYRDMQTTQKLQYVMVALELIIFVFFGAAMFYQAYTGNAPHFTPISASWFNPLELGSISALSAGVSVSLFVYWGWDVVLTMNEETENASTTSGKAATATILIVVAIYMFVTLGAMTYAGVGNTGLGLANPDIAENVFVELAGPVLGPLAILISLAVLVSSMASLQSTFVGPARTLLAMGYYGGLPKKFAWIHSRFFTPSFATVVAGLVAGSFYAIMRVLSENVLWDTVTTLGAMICFYYGLTSLACVVYFRKRWFKSVRDFFMVFLFPLLGALSLFVLFTITVWDSRDPSFGSGSEIFGVGLVFVLTIALIVLGLVLMLVYRFVQPAFFKSQLDLTRSVAPRDHDEEFVAV